MRRRGRHTLCAYLVTSIALAPGCEDPGLAQLERVRDEVCQCKTAKCGEAAMKKVEAVTVESSPRAQKHARDMMNCLAVLYAKPKDLDAEDLLGNKRSGLQINWDAAAEEPTRP